MLNPHLGAMIKPVHGRCNLQCAYCYYRPMPEILNESSQLGLEELERFTKEYLATNTVAPTMVWQGGEPTLAGLDFYEKAVELQRKYNKAPAAVSNAFQTNGILINEEWARFFSRNDFLVGVSVDGPEELHDKYRRDKEGTHARVMRAIETLRAARANFNVLVAVTDANVGHAAEVYEFFRQEGISFIEVIPVAEANGQGRLAPYSISPEEYGEFLVELFECWLGDRPLTVNVRLLDNIVRSFFGVQPEYCIFRDTCYNVVTLEANGGLYACDFFVTEEWRLGNIRTDRLEDVVAGERLTAFRRHVRSFRRECAGCRWFQICKGGCPKYRSAAFMKHAGGGNYFCRALKRFFERVEEAWAGFSEDFKRALAQKYSIPQMTLPQEPEPQTISSVGRNDPCPCGSGKKFKHCCMRRYSRKR